jgi:hypothetical protein
VLTTLPLLVQWKKVWPLLGVAVTVCGSAMAERVSGEPAEGEAMMREARKGESNRQARLERRRLMADSGAMPGSLAGKFTLGQDATLCVIANEHRMHGCCDLSLDEIADKASVGRSALQSALRKACELGLITVQNRGRLTNVVRIIAPEWLTWLQQGGGGGAARRPLQGAFVTDEEQRLLEIEEMRLVVKFGDKKRYSDREYEAIYQELAEAGLKDEAWDDLDAIEAVFRKLNADDEAAAARRALGG